MVSWEKGLEDLLVMGIHLEHIYTVDMIDLLVEHFSVMSTPESDEASDEYPQESTHFEDQIL